MAPTQPQAARTSRRPGRRARSAGCFGLRAFRRRDHRCGGGCRQHPYWALKSIRPDPVHHQGVDRDAGDAARRRRTCRARPHGRPLPVRVQDRRPAGGARRSPSKRLTHTGGFEGDIWAPTSDGEDALGRIPVAEHVSQAEQHAERGRRFSNCSAGFGVLGRVVEVLRGTSYHQVLRRHLTDPLGLDEVVVDVGEAPAYRMPSATSPPGRVRLGGLSGPKSRRRPRTRLRATGSP